MHDMSTELHLMFYILIFFNIFISSTCGSEMKFTTNTNEPAYLDFAWKLFVNVWQVYWNIIKYDSEVFLI